MADRSPWTIRRPTNTDELPAVSAPRFVGRTREIATLRRAFATPPALVLVEGEAGIGKSRLLHELFEDEVAGGGVLVAGAPPVRQAYTLGPIVDALRQAVDGVSELGLTTLAGALRPLFPEWVNDLPPVLEPAEDALAARHRLFRALVELIGCLDVDVLVMEDMHWADEATLEFLLFLAAQRPAPLSLAVTYRPEDVPPDSLLRRLSSRPPPSMTLMRLSLGPLDVEETAGLVSSMLADEPVSMAFAGFVHERTDGVPLAVEESVRLMYDRADLIRRGQEWVRRSLDDIHVPPTVRDAVLERAERLHPDARAALRAAAVFAEPIDPTVLLACAGLTEAGSVEAGSVEAGSFEAGSANAGLTRDLARSDWTEALSSGLLIETATGLVGFRHALAGRAVYESMPVSDRRMLHRRAGAALESLPRPPVAQLAWQFREAGDTERWHRYAVLAAEAAMATGDDAAAGTLLHDLLIGAELAPASVLKLVERLPLLSLSGPNRVVELLPVLRAAIESEALPPHQTARMRFQLGLLLDLVAEFDASRAEMELAIPGLGAGSLESVRAMLLLGWARGTTWPAHVHRQWLRRAAEVTPLLPADRRSGVTGERAAGLLLLGEEEGWAAVAEIPDAVDTAVARRAVLLRDLNVGDLAMRWGRYAEAKERLERASELVEQHQYLRIRGMAQGTLIHLDWFRGMWSGLRERADALAADDSVQAMDRLESGLVSALVSGAAGIDREAILVRTLDEVRQRGAVDCLMEPAAALARWRLANGRIDDALEVTEEPIAIVTHKEIWLWATDIAPARIDALVAAGRLDDATTLVAAFEHGLRGRDAPAPAAGLAMCRAMLAQGNGHQGNGQYDKAADLFAHAAAAWQMLPRPYDVLLARERQARCLLTLADADADADSGSTSRTDALELLKEVWSGLVDLGASGDADRVATTLRERGITLVTTWRGGRRGYGDNLSPRELDVVRLIIAGRTNREIAAALHRSPKTVATQLNSAMRKLNAPSRTAVAVRALEAGVTVDARAE